MQDDPPVSGPMSRRRFLQVGAGAAVLAAFPAPTLAGRPGSAPVIERITVLQVPGEFYRFVAMNAYDRAPKGKTGTIRVVRAVLSDGTVGLGVGGYRFNGGSVQDLRRMIGVDPRAVYTWEGGRITGQVEPFRSMLRELRFSWFESTLLDTVGKLEGRPVWQLFGPAVRDAVDCYDGTLYFADVHQGRDARAVGEIAARIREDGYRAIKMKLGRPFKWMPGEAGLHRDIEAFIAAREAVGSNFHLMADANNGYRDHPDWGLRLLEACEPHDMYWIEELFPESIEGYRELRRAMYERDCTVRIADGENVNRVDDFAPYIEAGSVDIYQPDMRAAGFSNILRAADATAARGIQLVPHNWRSEMGKLMSIHAARLRPNIRFVEDDRYHTYAFDTSAYLFRDGRWYAPDAPGWGVGLVDYDRFARQAEELVVR